MEIDMNHKREFRMLEQAPHPVRTGRFYVVENKWYFMAREYQDQGPFDSEEEAKKGLENFLATVTTKETDVWDLKIFPDIV